MAASNCDMCVNYVYDEDYECYNCLVNLDEDEMVRFLTDRFDACPYRCKGDNSEIHQATIDYFNSFLIGRSNGDYDSLAGCGECLWSPYYVDRTVYQDYKASGCRKSGRLSGQYYGDYVCAANCCDYGVLRTIENHVGTVVCNILCHNITGHGGYRKSITIFVKQGEEA